MEKEMTAYLLNYLLHNCFASKADMARKLDMNKRNLQRILNDPEHAKGGTLALDKAICFCALNQISLDPVLTAFFIDDKTSFLKTEEIMRESKPIALAAYTQIALPTPDNLSPIGMEALDSMLRFIQQLSLHICPKCTMWCNPWDGTDKLSKGSCYLARIAKYIYSDIVELYSKEGEK